MNISYCSASEIDLSHGKNMILVIYDSLGWRRDDVIRIPVANGDVTVYDSEGKVIESRLLPLADVHLNLRNYYVMAYWVELQP
ncbi:hypothetical protein Dsin_030140 [Dipteronia sinensis]|uniref:Uncharacterized protein n=1 Tax=Dipteronia sinensis TaxID=43782 RepID=A0AAE0DQY0_9ROSI|nr:hypothetical protein Dsin_030140 [Dipteronia sinensis]